MNEHLGVNKMGKNIRKSPLHQPNFGNPKQQQQQQQQPQPQVYNISKNDFRSIVQQLTGSPSHHDPPPPPPPRPAGPRYNPPKSPSLRLQRIRPPPLTPITRPPIPAPPPPPPPVPFNNNSSPNPNSPLFNWPSQFSPLPPITPGDSVWNNAAESPISAYMRYLQNSMIDSGGSRSTQLPGQGFGQGQPFTSGLLPTPPNAPVFPSPRGNVPALLPSPSSQFPFPSPSSFLNLLSPRSPYPLLSPGFQYPPLSPSFQFSPLSTPNFSLSPLPQQASGILGPGPQQPPLSSGILFPSSPSGFFPLKSPRWRE